MDKTFWSGPVGASYPHLARWVVDGWVEIGQDDFSRSFVRALDMGGMVWEGATKYPTLEDALADLDAGIRAYMIEVGMIPPT